MENGQQKKKVLKLASTLPPVPERRCVKVGLATVGDDGLPRYNWTEIERVWTDIWPDANMLAFSRHFQIPSQVLYNKFSKNGSHQEKVRSLKGLSARYWQGIKKSVLITGDSEKDSLMLREIIGELRVVCRAASALARETLTKETPDGKAVNHGVKLAQVKDAMVVASMVAMTMKDVNELFKSADEDRDRKPEPRPRPVLRLTPSVKTA